MRPTPMPLITRLRLTHDKIACTALVLLSGAALAADLHAPRHGARFVQFLSPACFYYLNTPLVFIAVARAEISSLRSEPQAFW